MAIKPRETWVRDFIAALDTFCAGGRNNGARSRRSDDQAERQPESRGRANTPAAPSGLEGHLKVYPDLGAACLRAKLDLPYRLWLRMRPVHEGCGRWSLQDAYELSGGTRRQTRAWLRAGIGTFWTKTHTGYYELIGLEKLSVSMGTSPDKRGAYVPEEQIENLGRFRAAILGTWCDKPVTISNERLAAIFGRKTRTIQRWKKLTGLSVGHNLGWTRLADHEDIAEKAAEVKATHCWIELWDGPPGKRYKRGDKPEPMRVVVWQLPSTHRSPYERAPKTRLQRSACQALSKLGNTSRAADRVFCPRGPGQARQAARLLESTGTALVEEKRAHHGYGLWERCAV